MTKLSLSNYSSKRKSSSRHPLRAQRPNPNKIKDIPLQQSLQARPPQAPKPPLLVKPTTIASQTNHH